MHYAGNRISQTNPLRSIPLIRPAGMVLPLAALPVSLGRAPLHQHPAPAVADLLARDLANAAARLREAVRLYDGARQGIGEANRTHTAGVVSGGRVIMAPPRFSAERMRERKSAAFRLFNQRRRELGAARRQVEAARAALGLEPLAAIEARAVIRAELRASKRRSFGLAA